MGEYRKNIEVSSYKQQSIAKNLQEQNGRSTFCPKTQQMLLYGTVVWHTDLVYCFDSDVSPLPHNQAQLGQCDSRNSCNHWIWYGCLCHAVQGWQELHDPCSCNEPCEQHPPNCLCCTLHP